MRYLNVMIMCLMLRGQIMNEKRFTLDELYGYVIEDNKKRLTDKQVVDLLNELSGENERLRQSVEYWQKKYEEGTETFQISENDTMSEKRFRVRFEQEDGRGEIVNEKGVELTTREVVDLLNEQEQKIQILREEIQSTVYILKMQTRKLEGY